MKESSGYKLWMRRIKGGTATMAQCRNFAQAIAPIFQNLPAGGKKTNVTIIEAGNLVAQLRDKPLVLSDEDCERGLLWLRKYGHKTIGAPVEKIEAARIFHFSGLIDYRDAQHIYPVWNVCDGEGHVLFFYYRIPWQARMGENPLNLPAGGYWD